MTKKNSTKRALVLSFLSLFLCFSMLIGTTFAWFTDEVSSKNNIIKAGNLDIELYYQNDEVSDWTKVDSNTNIFKENTLWEPGHTEVVKLKVVNEGTLALKYQLGINVESEITSTNVLGAELKLSDHIKYGVVDGNQDYTRDTAVAAVEATATKLNVTYGSGTIELAPKAEKIVTMVVYMPTSVGNEANAAKDAKTPTINLGINLFATQLANEEDSFGPDYDEDAWHNSMKVYTADDLQSAVANGKDVVLMNDIELTESLVIPAAQKTKLSTKAVSDDTIVIDLNGKNIVITTAYDDKNATASSAIVNNGSVVLKGVGSVSATNNYTVRNYGTMVIDGITVENGIMNFADLTVESGNISNSRSGKHSIYGNNAKLTINGGIFHNENPGNATIFSYAGEVVINNGEFTIADGTATLGWTSCLLDAQGNAKFTINDGVVNGEIRDYNKNTIVYGGTFTHNSVKNFLADGLKAVENNGIYYIISENNSFVANGVTINANGAYEITNAAGLTWLANTVNANSETLKGKTILLMNDIDLENKAWTPIGNGANGFTATFDGQGNTVYNLNVSGTTSIGLFGYALNGGNIKNLTVENATVTATDYAGAILGRGYTDVVNCHVKNATITVTPALTDKGVYDGGAKAGAVVGQLLEGAGNTVVGCTAENVVITGYRDLGGVLGMAHNNNSVSGCSANNVTIHFVSVDGTYDDGKTPNQNAGAIVGRIQSSATVDFTAKQNADFVCGVDSVEAFKAALNNGAANIIFDADITGDVTFTQVNGVSLVIDGNDKIMNGSIDITARADTSDKATIVIKNINFKTTDTKRTFINSVETNRYPNNVTVSGCTFEGTGADSDVVAITIKSANNFVIENCTATKVHSILQNTSGWNLTVKDVTVTESGRGMSLGTVQGVTLDNVKVEAVKYGIRMDAGYNNNAVITDCNVKAFIPVVVRKVSVDSSVTFNGTNTMTQTNTDGIWCAIGASEYETNGTLPTAASKTVTVTLDDASLSAAGVYNNSGK